MARNVISPDLLPTVPGPLRRNLAHRHFALAKTVISLNNVAKTYSHERNIGPVSRDITAGVITALVGPNGAGKSTLLTMVGTHKRGDTAGRNVKGHWANVRLVGIGLRNVIELVGGSVFLIVILRKGRP